MAHTTTAPSQLLVAEDGNQDVQTELPSKIYVEIEGTFYYRYCGICFDLDFEDINLHGYGVMGSFTNVGDGLSLSLHINRLKQGRGLGCRSCSAILHIINYMAPIYAESWMSCSVLLDSRAGQPTLMGVLPPPGSTWFGLTFQIFRPEGGTVSLWPKLGSSHHLPPHLGSVDGNIFVQEKLNLCIENHSAICGSDGPTPLPKRLLDIRSTVLMGDHPLAIRLCEPGSITGRYAALSYCWGGSLPIKLDSSTAPGLKSKIELDLLPRTFQDAIYVCQRLSIRYLWIDSLCIFQDDVEDWEEESAKMGSYYENAFIVIAATSCSNADTPFLKAVDERWMSKELDISGLGITRGESRLYVRELDHRKIDMFAALGPLSTRGWAWQENILARRVVHYTRSEILWECRCGIISQIPRKNGRGFSQILKEQDIDLNTGWHHLVVAYSTRELTFRKDKLPSISGVASKILNQTNSPYVAGHWLAWLPGDLAWSTTGWAGNYALVSQMDAPPLYIDTGVPSWSWASVDRHISWKCVDYASIARVEAVHCTVPGRNPLGIVTDGYIVLTGPVIRLKIQSTSSMWKTYVWPKYMLMQEGFQTTVDVNPDTLLCPCYAPTSSGLQPSVERAKDYLVPVLDELDHEVFCIVLCKEVPYLIDRSSPQPRLSIPVFVCMVLGRSSKTPGAYTRLTLSWFSDEERLTTAENMTVKIV